MFRGFARVVLAVGTSLLGASLQADVIYTYEGNPFDQHFLTSCPPVCSVSGYFVVPTALPSNTSLSVTPTEFSFTDGLATINTANSTPNVWGATTFWVFTDAFGAITQWNNSYASATNMIWSGTAPLGCTGCIVSDEGGAFSASGFDYYARVLDNPGQWSIADTTVPEPSTLLLVVLGLGATRSWSRRP